MDKKVIQTIEAILQRSNDAVVRKKGDSIVVLEDKKTIKYSTWRIGVTEDHWGQRSGFSRWLASFIFDRPEVVKLRDSSGSDPRKKCVAGKGSI